LYKRYLEKLTEQETQIERLQAAIDHAAAETRAASAGVDSFIAQMTI